MSKKLNLSDKQIDELIESNLERFRVEHAGENFTYRKYQKEAIVAIIKSFIDGDKKHFLLEAPTGAGKSIIGICVAYVLNNLGFTGYILASDLNLQSQYAEDFKRLKLDWGCVKGIDNYVCIENGEKHSCGNCHMRNESADKIKERKCYPDCPYFQARNRASTTPTSLLNYSYWLIQRNYVAEMMGHSMFEKRDFIICDEAHKLVDIVQNHFAPLIAPNTAMKLEQIVDNYSQEGLWSGMFNAPDWDSLVTSIINDEDKESQLQKLATLEQWTEVMVGAVKDYKEKIANKCVKGSLPKNMKKMVGLMDWVKDLHCKLEDYVNIINEVGIESMVPCVDKFAKTATFKTLNEKYLMERFFHNEHEFSLLMTATMGDPKTFYDNMKGPEDHNCKACKIPSTFDFSRSPIYAFKGHSMSYKNKEKNTPWVIEKVDEILAENEGKKGIIHCGSYALGEKLLSMTKHRDRLISYKQGEKESSLAMFRDSKDKVLIGPSILEGVNLEDDASRFQIFVKVPYASLADKFVQEKLNADRRWYQNDAIMKILQGVGRSVRNKNDWAVTYILDGDFIRLWRENAKQFTKEFNERLQLV